MLFIISLFCALAFLCMILQKRFEQMLAPFVCGLMLVDAARHLSPQFMTYTPGMQLFQWLGLAALEEWNAGVVYCMLWIFYAVFLMPFAQRITWKSCQPGKRFTACCGMRI